MIAVIDIEQVAMELAKADYKSLHQNPETKASKYMPTAADDSGNGFYFGTLDYYFETISNLSIPKDIWTKVTEQNPPHGTEVLMFHADYKDEDVNPDGVVVGYQINDEQWFISKFCNHHDEWHTRECKVKEENREKIMPIPTHWKHKPQSPQD